MSMQRNYYEILGLPQAASTDEIKKKYRELARVWHPDVVKDKSMGQRVFSQINQAYRVLGDAERRAQYNSILAQAARPSTNGARPNGMGSNGSAPYANGNGTAAYANGNGAAQQTTTPPQPPSAQKLEAIAGLLSHADNAIMAGKPVEAGAFCMKVLEIDPRSARALDIFGDALLQQGRREDAAVQYRKALQVAPSHSIQSKLARLDQAATSNRTNPIGQSPPQRPDARRPPAAPAEEKPSGLFGRFLGRK